MASRKAGADAPETGEESPDLAATPGQRQSDAAFEAIRRSIVLCQLLPSQVVSEAEMEERFSLKRAATRVALERLAAQGLVRPIHRRGYEVRPITLRDLTELYQFREVVELGTLRLALGRVDEAELRRLDAACGRPNAPADREAEDRLLRANTEFHLAIARATGNERLTSSLGDVMRQMERLFHFGLAIGDRSEPMRNDHSLMIDALVRGDCETAERLAREDLAASRAGVLSALISSASLMDVSIAGRRLAE